MQLTPELKAKIQELYDVTPESVHGVALGYKQTGGETTGKISIVFSVDRKLPPDQIPSDELLPREIVVDGGVVSTDVQEQPRLSLVGCNEPGSPNITRLAPVENGGTILTPFRGGQEIIQFPTGMTFNSSNIVTGVSVGTLGFFCIDDLDGKTVGVTNAHVVVNKYIFCSERPVDDYNSYDPRQVAGFGSPYPPGAVMYKAGLGFDEYRVAPNIKRYTPASEIFTNYVDAAVLIMDPDTVNGETIITADSHKVWGPIGEDPFSTPMPFATTAEIDALLSTNPRCYSTGRTSGPKGFTNSSSCRIRVTNVGLSATVDTMPYGDLIRLEYEDGGEGVVQGGDSGSALIAQIDGSYKIIGLVFAAASTFAVASRIDRVASEMRLRAWDGTLDRTLHTHVGKVLVPKNDPRAAMTSFIHTDGELYWQAGFVIGASSSSSVSSSSAVSSSSRRSSSLVSRSSTSLESCDAAALSCINLISNGDFNLPASTPGNGTCVVAGLDNRQGMAAAPPWWVEFNCEVYSFKYCDPAVDDNRFVGFGHSENMGLIGQAIQTCPGHTYSASFKLGNQPGYNAQGGVPGTPIGGNRYLECVVYDLDDARLAAWHEANQNATFFGAPDWPIVFQDIFSVVATNVGSTYESLAWENKSFTFTATAKNTLIVFRTLDTRFGSPRNDLAYVVIDDVVVESPCSSSSVSFSSAVSSSATPSSSSAGRSSSSTACPCLKDAECATGCCWGPLLTETVGGPEGSSTSSNSFNSSAGLVKIPKYLTLSIEPTRPHCFSSSSSARSSSSRSSGSQTSSSSCATEPVAIGFSVNSDGEFLNNFGPGDTATVTVLVSDGAAAERSQVNWTLLANGNTVFNYSVLASDPNPKTFTISSEDLLATLGLTFETAPLSSYTFEFCGEARNCAGVFDTDCNGTIVVKVPPRSSSSSNSVPSEQSSASAVSSEQSSASAVSSEQSSASATSSTSSACPLPAPTFLEAWCDPCPADLETGAAFITARLRWAAADIPAPSPWAPYGCVAGFEIQMLNANTGDVLETKYANISAGFITTFFETGSELGAEATAPNQFRIRALSAQHTEPGVQAGEWATFPGLFSDERCCGSSSSSAQSSNLSSASSASCGIVWTDASDAMGDQTVSAAPVATKGNSGLCYDNMTCADKPPYDAYYSVIANGVQTFTFSSPVKDPVLALFTFGNNFGTTSQCVASVPAELYCGEVSGLGCEASTASSPVVVSGNTITGVEGYGLVVFRGTHSSITLTWSDIETVAYYRWGKLLCPASSSSSSRSSSSSVSSSSVSLGPQFYCVEDGPVLDAREMILIPDAGNLPYTTINDDVATAVGAVDYEFRISKYELTNTDYAEFLNAVGQSNANDVYSGSFQFSGIAQNGTSGSYTYSVVPGYEYKPVNWVTWYSAARYINWLNNGKPVDATGAAVNNGTYDLSQPNPTRNPNANYWLPSVDEWVKAAFYNPANQTYSQYATRSNTPPTPGSGGAITNGAVYGYDESAMGPQSVGAYPNATSWYGLNGASGNVREWTDSARGSDVALLNGSYSAPASFYISINNVAYEERSGSSRGVGFRVAMRVPNSSSSSLASGINSSSSTSSSSAVSVSGAFTLSGAGTSSVNGCYAEAGTFNGKPYYTNGARTVWFEGFENTWFISQGLEQGPPDYVGFSADDVPTTWILVDGQEPVPTISQGCGNNASSSSSSQTNSSSNAATNTAFLVSGAGKPDFDGLYCRVDDWNSRPSYKNISISPLATALYIYFEGGDWLISCCRGTNRVHPIHSGYYVAQNLAALNDPPLSGWMSYANAGNDPPEFPVPTLSITTCDGSTSSSATPSSSSRQPSSSSSLQPSSSSSRSSSSVNETLDNVGLLLHFEDAGLHDTSTLDPLYPNSEFWWSSPKAMRARSFAPNGVAFTTAASRFGTKGARFSGEVRNNAYSNVQFSGDAYHALPSQYTLEMWFKPATVWSGQVKRYLVHGAPFIEGGTPIGGNFGHYDLYYAELDDGTNGALHFELVGPGASEGDYWYVDIERPVGPLSSAWHHVAVVRDGKTIRLYLDGNKLGADATATVGGNYSDDALFQISTLLVFGAKLDTMRQYIHGWAGDIDDIRVTYAALYSGSTITVPSAEFNDGRDGSELIVKAVHSASGVFPVSSFNEYTKTGYGRENIPLTVTLGGEDNADNRMWIRAAVGGRIHYSVTCSAAANDGAALFKYSPSVENWTPRNHGCAGLEGQSCPDTKLDYGDTTMSSPSAALASAWVSSGTITGSVDVAKGDYLILAFTKDASGAAGTDSVSASFYIKPIDPLCANVSLLLHGDGSNGSQTVLDSSPNRYLLTAGGNAQISTAESVFGGASIAFDGNGDYLQLPDTTTSKFDFSGNFAIEFYVRLNAMPTGANWLNDKANHMCLLSHGLAGDTNGYSLAIGATYIVWRLGDDRIIEDTHGMSVDKWHYVVLARADYKTRLFVDGKLVSEVDEWVSNPLKDFTVGGPFWIGAEKGQGLYLNGYIDELRVTKGTSRGYSVMFDPEDDPLTADVPPEPFCDCDANPAPSSSSSSSSAAATSALAVAATYGYRALVGAFAVSADSVSGAGTAASPLVVVLGGADDQDNRVWIQVQQSGTLNFSVTASSEKDYDGGRLYITSASPAQHNAYTAFNGADPAGYTPVSAWRDGNGIAASSGTLAVTAGQYLVLLYTKDSSEQDGTDTITATVYVTT